MPVKVFKLLVPLIITVNSISAIFFDGYLTAWIGGLEPTAKLLVRLAVVILLLAYILSIVLTDLFPKKVHTFSSESSKRFRRYFSKWYSQTGYLRIYCKHLTGWADEGMVYDALKQKSKDGMLSLFLKEITPAARALEAEGAKLYPADDRLFTNHRFSIREVDGLYSIIIRDTKMTNGKIAFQESSDTYTAELLSYLIDNAELFELLS